MASKQTQPIQQQAQQQQQLSKQKAAEAEAEKVKEYIAKRVLPSSPRCFTYADHQNSSI